MYTPDPVRGTLTSATPVVIGLPKDQRYPATFALNSNAAGRLIEYSVDGVIWQAAVIDVTSTNQLIVRITSSQYGLRVTGQAGDTWTLR